MVLGTNEDFGERVCPSKNGNTYLIFSYLLLSLFCEIIKQDVHTETVGHKRNHSLQWQWFRASICWKT